MINRKELSVIFIIFILFYPSTLKASNDPIEPILLTLKSHMNSEHIHELKNYLAEINIELNIKIETWIAFIGTITSTYDFDLVEIGLMGGGTSPDLTGVYNQNGSLNFFGISADIPYGQENEDYLKEGVTIMDLKKRQQHYYQWQELLMDKILPMIPMFSQSSYAVNWANLKGYTYALGIAESLPFMEFDGLHLGQSIIDELNIADAMWRDLNPLTQDYAYSSFVSSLIMEPLIKIHPGGEPLTTGLIENWEQNKTNPNLFKFTMRENVFWAPSFNITGRDADSDPLVDYTTNTTLATDILMNGIQGENSKGTNQQVTAKDAVFTLLTWANNITSNDAEEFSWMNNIWVDPVDDLIFYIEIDRNPETEELEGYGDFFYDLSLSCLPEFFLNGTNTTTTYSSSGVPMVGIDQTIKNSPQWRIYSISAFGCGTYMLDYYLNDTITVLQKSPFWHGIAIDGTEQKLAIQRVNIHIIPDIMSGLNAFKAGEIDLMDITALSEERKKMETNPAYEVQSRIGLNFILYGFNFRRPSIGDKSNYIFINETEYKGYTKALALRKAICYAINRQEINEQYYNNERIISDSPIYPVQKYWYYENITAYNYNLEEAHKWLNLAQSKTEQTTTSLSQSLFWALTVTVLYFIRKRRSHTE